MLCFVWGGGGQKRKKKKKRKKNRLFDLSAFFSLPTSPFTDWLQTCLMHSAEKVGLSALGKLTRSKGGSVLNAFPRGAELFDAAHRIAVYLHTPSVAKVLSAHCRAAGCPETKVKPAFNKTRIASPHGQLVSLIAVLPGIQAFAESGNWDTEKAPILNSVEWQILMEMEATLAIMRKLTTRAQNEKHFNAAYEHIFKVRPPFLDTCSHSYLQV